MQICTSSSHCRARIALHVIRVIEVTLQHNMASSSQHLADAGNTAIHTCAVLLRAKTGWRPFKPEGHPGSQSQALTSKGRLYSEYYVCAVHTVSQGVRTLTGAPPGCEYRVNIYLCTPPGGAGAL